MRLRLGDTVLELKRGKPLLMGIVNATPDSFSDPPGAPSVDELVARGEALARAGAAIVDVGGESGRTDTTPIPVEEEIARVAPVVERLAGGGLLVSVDTWRLEPARAALEAGAAIINDSSGLSEPALAELCAQADAALVITHTRAAPKQKRFFDYGDIVDDVVRFLAAHAELARARGLAEDSILLDPGIDLAKTPAQSVELLRRLRELEPLGRPLLVAISRKDFVGALTGRSPAARDAASLAAIEPALDLPGAVLRVHDVEGASDFLRVRSALRGEGEEPVGAVAEWLRREEAA